MLADRPSNILDGAAEAAEGNRVMGANDRADKIKELMLIYRDLPPEGQERFRRIVDMIVRANTPATPEEMEG